jgi:hypothetical protein
LLPAILRRHWYTSGRPSHQRCNTQQQHNTIVNYTINNSKIIFQLKVVIFNNQQLETR